MSATDPAALTALTVISFGAGAFLVAFRRPAMRWINAHAQRSFGDVLLVAAGLAVYLFIAVYSAMQGNGPAIVIIVAIALGAVSVPALGLLMPTRRQRRTAAKSGANEPVNTEYIRILFGFLLLLIAAQGLLLLVLVVFHVNPLVAIGSVVVVGTIAIVALTVAGAMDLRQRGALSDASATDIVKASLLILSRLIPTDLFRQLRS